MSQQEILSSIYTDNFSGPTDPNLELEQSLIEPNHEYDLRRPQSGDLNGDGFEDLVVTEFDPLPSHAHNGLETKLSIYMNNPDSKKNPNFSFYSEILPERPSEFPPGQDFDEPVYYDLGDIDGDGDLDIVLGTPSTWTDIYLNDGNGNFRLAEDIEISIPGVRHLIQLEDMDEDGDLDIIALNDNSGEFLVEVFWQDADGNFDLAGTKVGADGIEADEYTSVDSINTWDFNEDGIRDILLMGYSNEGAHPRLYYGQNGSKGPVWLASDRYDFDSGKMGEYDEFWGLVDIDDDETMEILVGQYLPGRYDNSALFYLDYEPTGGYPLEVDFTKNTLLQDSDNSENPVVGAREASLGDFNGDGKLDIAMSGWPDGRPDISVAYGPGFDPSNIEVLGKVVEGNIIPIEADRELYGGWPEFLELFVTGEDGDGGKYLDLYDQVESEPGSVDPIAVTPLIGRKFR